MSQQHLDANQFPPGHINNAPAAVLKELGIVQTALLGRGGESWVYALDPRRVARISRFPNHQEEAAARASLLAELGRSADRLPFAIPQVLDILSLAGYTITVERRLPGRPAIEQLAVLSGQARAALVRNYLQAAASIGDLAIHRPWYGDLLGSEAVHSPTFRGYLERRARHSLAKAGRDFSHVDPVPLALDLPEPGEPAFVHLDAFLGNMLADGETITAVLDFGATTLIGDRRLDPLAAAIYLAPQITPAANVQDRSTAQQWLAEQGLSPLFEPAQAWIAAYWSFAFDDISLYHWCQSILL